MGAALGGGLTFDAAEHTDNFYDQNRREIASECPPNPRREDRQVSICRNFNCATSCTSCACTASLGAQGVGAAGAGGAGSISINPGCTSPRQFGGGGLSTGCNPRSSLDNNGTRSADATADSADLTFESRQTVQPLCCDQSTTRMCCYCCCL